MWKNHSTFDSHYLFERNGMDTTLGKMKWGKMEGGRKVRRKREGEKERGGRGERPV